MFKFRQSVGAGNSGYHRYHFSSYQRHVSFQRLFRHRTTWSRSHLLCTIQRSLKKREIANTASRKSTHESLLLGRLQDVSQASQNTEEAIHHSSDRKGREERLSDHSERIFASITQLPPDFFHDVQLLRSLAGEGAIVKNATQQTLTLAESGRAIDERKEGGSNIELSYEPEYRVQSLQGNLETIDYDGSFGGGFWSLEAQGSQTTELKAEEESGGIQEVIHEKERSINSIAKPRADVLYAAPAVQLLEVLNQSPLRRGKLDLSKFDAWAVEAGVAATSTQGHAAPALLFQPYSGLRRVLRKFMDQVYERIMISLPERSNTELDPILNQVLSKNDLHLLSRAGYRVEDLLSWSWILLAPPAQSIRRYVAFCKWQQRQGRPVVPQFVALQLLRLETIDAHSLGTYLNETMRIANNWQWLGSSKNVIVVRLLRHARITAPDLFEPIIKLTFTLFPANASGDRTKAADSKLTHWFNRLLSLLALPISARPFKSMHFQQHAQLEVVRHMQKYSPKIPITREGYRALSEVQLMHKKTKPEQDWARVKDLSWPPWRLHDQVGVNSADEYPGQQSRVRKVLQRMQESGYQLGHSEMAAQVLTGWDTDSSPTIQVRRVGNMVSSRRPWLLGPKFDAAELPERVWTARIEATRSVREAWMCFCFYIQSVQPAQQSVKVYRSMFSKLLARTIEDRSADAPLPGDGLEVHLDPVLARDRVYIPEPVPTVEELYKRMRTMGIKSDLRLLSDLLDSAGTIEEGFKYIKDANLSPQTKDALLRPEQVSPNTIGHHVRGLPTFFLGSFFYLLCRRETSEVGRQKAFPSPSSEGSEDKSYPQVRLPVEFALRTIGITKISAPHVLNHALRGLRTYIRRRKHGVAPMMGLAMVWFHVQRVLACIRDGGNLFDIMTYRNVSYIVQQIQTWSDPRASHLEEAALRTIQEIFMQATIGKRISAHDWIPSPNSQHTHGLLRVLGGSDIDWMVWHLAYTQNENTIELVLDFLSWVMKVRSSLDEVNGQRLARFPIIAFRVVLEGSWADQRCWEECKVRVANEEQLQEARQLCEPSGWPTDDEVAEYLRTRDQSLKRFRTMMLSRKRSET